MKKLTLVLIVFLLSLTSVFAEEITYVYKNSVSSVGLDNPHVGNSYYDKDRNLVVVSHKRKDVTEFDVIRTKTKIEIGNIITKKRFPLMFLEGSASLNKVGANLSVNTFAYPVSLMVAFDTDYEFKSENLYMGLRADMPLSNLSENKFTLVEDAAIYAYSLFGANLNCLDDNEFLIAKWGLGYRHIFGEFFWSVEYDSVWKHSEHAFSTDFAFGFGVMI